MSRKLLILECAGLDEAVLRSSKSLASLLRFQPLAPVFPAVTCTAQASMRTGLPPSAHGIIANGRYDRRQQRVEFWNQSAALYQGKRIWENAQKSGKTAAVMFTQQSLGDTADYILSPAPIHKHHGGMIMGCHTKPAALEDELLPFLGGKFKLHRYWGPLAGDEASDMCAKCTLGLMKLHAPDLLFSYLPNLDYVLQREGPKGKNVGRSADYLANCLGRLLDCGRELGYETIVWGDYAIGEVGQVAYPNKLLLEAGLFQCREIDGMLYPNLYDSRAFAMCDHQIAHVFVKYPKDIPLAKAALSGKPGIESLRTPAEADLNHPECGELVLTAAPGAWFAYSWWERQAEAPDYATHVDIHNKIGFDPCELFWKFPLLSTCQDCSRIRGSHGRTDTPAQFAVSDGLNDFRNASNLLELANMISEVQI